MRNADSTNVRYAPLYICSIKLATAKTFNDTEFANFGAENADEIDNISDKLKFLRLNLGLKQSEVANRLGVSRYVYGQIEQGHTQFIPKPLLCKIAKLYKIKPSEISDEYNQFIYSGQGKAIRKLRKSEHLEINAFAEKHCIRPHLLKAWEDEKKQVSKSSWEKYFKNK